MAIESTVIYGPSRGIDAESYWIERAAQRLSLAPSQAASYFNHFATGRKDWTNSLAGTGANQNMNVAGGVIQLTSGATAASTGDLALGDGGTYFPNWFPNGATKKWYLASRLRMTTAIDAAAICGLSSRDWSTGALQLTLGVEGSVSAANWVLKGGVGSLDSGVAVVTNTWAVLEAWRDGATTFMTVDLVTKATGALVHPSVDGGLWLPCRNGATAAARTMQVDWVASLVPEAA